MSPARIKEHLEKRPFVPFTIHTGDGSTIRVKSQEFAALAPGGRTLVVFTGRKVAGDDEMQVIDVFLITKIITTGGIASSRRAS